MKKIFLVLCVMGSMQFTQAHAEQRPLQIEQRKAKLSAISSVSKNESCPASGGACAGNPFHMAGRMMKGIAATPTPAGFGMSCRISVIRNIRPLAFVLGL